MVEKLIRIETAKLAKEKGFCEVCQNDCRYNKEGLQTEVPFIQKLHNEAEFNIPAPTQAFLQKWLRETHDIDLWFGQLDNPNRYHVEDIVRISDNTILGGVSKGSPTYEEALELGLMEALKFI